MGSWGKRTVKKMTYFRNIPKTGVTDFKDSDATVGSTLKRVSFDKGFPQIDYDRQVIPANKDVYKVNFNPGAFQVPRMKPPENVDMPDVNVGGEIRMPKGRIPPDISLPKMKLNTGMTADIPMNVNVPMSADVPMNGAKISMPKIRNPKMSVNVPGKTLLDDVPIATDVDVPDLLGNIKGKSRKTTTKYP